MRELLSALPQAARGVNKEWSKTLPEMLYYKAICTRVKLCDAVMRSANIIIIIILIIILYLSETCCRVAGISTSQMDWGNKCVRKSNAFNNYNEHRNIFAMQ